MYESLMACMPSSRVPDFHCGVLDLGGKGDTGIAEQDIPRQCGGFRYVNYSIGGGMNHTVPSCLPRNRMASGVAL
jgi:hypothetical protein